MTQTPSMHQLHLFKLKRALMQRILFMALCSVIFIMALIVMPVESTSLLALIAGAYTVSIGLLATSIIQARRTIKILQG